MALPARNSAMAARSPASRRAPCARMLPWSSARIMYSGGMTFIATRFCSGGKASWQMAQFLVYRSAPSGVAARAQLDSSNTMVGRFILFGVLCVFYHSSMDLKAITLEIPQDGNIIVGHSHFIKTVE